MKLKRWKKWWLKYFRNTKWDKSGDSDSTSELTVFNKTVGLKESFSKEVKV